MTKNELFYFLGKCLSLGQSEENKQEVIRTIYQEEVDWERFVFMASNQFVLPSVYLRFKQQGILPYLPVELSDHLKMVYDLNYQRNTTIMKQMNRINCLFAVVGIVPIYLKGTANMLDHLYEDLGERMVSDIDLLVSDDDFIQAANLLKGEGYEHVDLFFEDQQSATKHFPRLVHPTELVDIEVHRVPVDIDLSAHFNYDIINPEKKRIETNPPCYVLSDRHKVILNFMHGFMASDVRLMHQISFQNMVDLFFLSHRINVYEVLVQLPSYTGRALVYVDFVNYTMGFNNSHQPNFRSKLFIQKHDLFQKSKLWYHLVWVPKYLVGSMIWSGYLRNCIGVVYSRQIRKSVFRRLSTPSWYISHIKWHSNSFKQNFRRKK